ncbi:MAG: TolC family protein [Prolixibacteraceae bacterium]
MRFRRMIKRIFAATIVLLGSISVSAQDDVMDLSLSQACSLAVEKNVQLQNAELEQQKSQFQIKESRSKLYPQLEGYSSFSYYYAIPKMIVPGELFGQSGLIPVEIGTKYDWSSGFKATQMLYNQSYFTSLKIARQMENLSKLSLQRQKEEIVYQVSQVYFLCQNTEKQMDLLSKTLSNTDRLLEISKLQSDNGIIRKVDHARVQVNKNNLQTEMDNLEQLHQQQLGLLKYLTGMEADRPISLSDSLSAEAAMAVQEPVDFNNQSEIQLLDKQSDIGRLSLKSNKQAYLPTLSGFGEYYYQGQRNEFDFFKGGEDKFFKVGLVGISLNIPVFDGFEKQSKIKQHHIELMQLQNTRRNTINLFSKEYTDAVRQYNNCSRAMIRQEKNITVAEDTYDISLQGYRQQVVPLSDLLLSESGLTEARLSYYNALMQLKNAELDLKKGKGELLNF